MLSSVLSLGDADPPSLIRFAAANVVSMVTSVVAAAQQPDPSESGLFDMPPRPRQKGYLLLESEYTYVLLVSR